MGQERNLGPADGEPSRDEVRQRVNSLYDHAESATGKYNATRARTVKSLGFVPSAGGRSRGGDADLGASGLTQRWFNATRALLGPTVPAVLPPDRMAPRTATAPSARPAERRPAAPAAPPKQLEPQFSIPELPAVPGPRPPLTPPAPTASPALAFESAPAAGPETTQATTVGMPPEGPGVLLPPPAEPLPSALQATLPVAGPTTLTTAPPTALATPPPTAPAPAHALTTAPAPVEAPVSTPVGAPITDGMWAVSAGVGTAPAVGGGRGLAAVAFARAQTGKPCVWGATGPESYDCSSLTRAAWRSAGVDLPRTAQDQAFAGTPVPLTGLQPGDLVFYYADAHHVGVYTGDGTVVHAPAPGAVIREEPVLTAGNAAVHSAVRPA